MAQDPVHEFIRVEIPASIDIQRGHGVVGAVVALAHPVLEHREHPGMLRQLKRHGATSCRRRPRRRRRHRRRRWRRGLLGTRKTLATDAVGLATPEALLRGQPGQTGASATKLECFARRIFAGGVRKRLADGRECVATDASKLAASPPLLLREVLGAGARGDAAAMLQVPPAGRTACSVRRSPHCRRAPRGGVRHIPGCRRGLPGGGRRRFCCRLPRRWRRQGWGRVVWRGALASDTRVLATPRLSLWGPIPPWPARIAGGAVEKQRGAPLFFGVPQQREPYQVKQWHREQEEDRGQDGGRA
mmetsp:Transcript_102525/g.295161  ORF Transcript_102525/g.295161 Transcript_102525/m.295161 type:complete len:302 (-) Transcript_102525:222-1127(-)